jgi:hypothetical protein
MEVKHVLNKAVEKNEAYAYILGRIQFLGKSCGFRDNYTKEPEHPRTVSLYLHFRTRTFSNHQ